MNVTLTSAKRGIVVVGHGATLRSDTKGWGRWLQWIQSQTFGSRQHSRKRAAVVVQARSTTFVGCQQDSKTLILPHHDVRFPWSESGGASGHASARVQSLSRSSPGVALGFVLLQMDVVLLRAVQGRHHHHDRGH